MQARLSGLARVQSARAALDKAQLDLERTAIRSPIDGIASVARAQLGDLVGPGDAEPLTSVSQVDPIRVSFPLAEREYLGFVRGARDGSSGRDPAADADRLELVLADGSIWPKRGRVVPAAAGVDPRTGTILVRGEFANPDRVLRPGQYARVRAVTELRRDAFVVPQRAVTELQGLLQVAIVGEGDVVSMRVVEVGPRIGGDQVIEKGVAAGERVIVEGIQKVRDGATVRVRPAAPSAPAATPTSKD